MGAIKVGDRVTVRINFADQVGTVTRYARKGFWVVTTDSGDCRTYDESSIRPAR